MFPSRGGENGIFTYQALQAPYVLMGAWYPVSENGQQGLRPPSRIFWIEMAARARPGDGLETR